MPCLVSALVFLIPTDIWYSQSAEAWRKEAAFPLSGRAHTLGNSSCRSWCSLPMGADARQPSCNGWCCSTQALLSVLMESPELGHAAQHLPVQCLLILLPWQGEASLLPLRGKVQFILLSVPPSASLAGPSRGARSCSHLQA